MKKSVHLLVLAIILIAFLVAVTQGVDDKQATAALEETVSLAEESIQAEDVDLRVVESDQVDHLAFGTQSEVFRFGLDANAAYTIRYMTFDVQYAGLESAPLSHPSSWKLYGAHNGDVNYSDTLAYGEAFEGGLLRMRAVANRDRSGIIGEKGVTEFALVTTVLRADQADSEAFVGVGLPASDTLADDFDWSWVTGLYDGSWLSLSEKLGAADVSGLPFQGTLR